MTSESSPKLRVILNYLENWTLLPMPSLRIRGAHIGAGSRLPQLIVDEVRGRLSQLDGQPVLLDLEYGQAWVVQVNAVDMEEQEHPIDQTNRSLWSDDPFF